MAPERVGHPPSRLLFFVGIRRARRLRPAEFDFFHALANSFFYAFVGGMVIGAVPQIVGEALHVGDFAFDVVGILVTLAVSEALHQSGGCVSQGRWGGFGRGW